MIDGGGDCKQHPFDVFGVCVCIIQNLTGVVEGIFRFGGSMRV